MNSDLPPIPPGHIWLPVCDFPSALLALEILLDYIRTAEPTSDAPDYDEV